MGYIDVAGLAHTLPDGRQLFADVSFRVGEGAKVALVGPNGAGKTTLIRMVAGDVPVGTGTISRGGGLGVMRQFIGMIGDDRTLEDLALSLVAPALREARQRLDRAEAAMRSAEAGVPSGLTGPVGAAPARGTAPRAQPARTQPARADATRFQGARADTNRTRANRAAGPGGAAGAASAVTRAQLRYADALVAWGEAGGYEAEVLFDTVSVLVLDLPWERSRNRPVRTLSGGQQKRFALELLLRGPDEVLLLDEPDNFLDVSGKRWLEQRLNESTKSVLYVSHDRELLANTANRVVTVEGDSAWVHPGGFADWHEARVARHERLDERRRRWDEEHAKLRALMLMYKQKAAYNSDMANRYQAAQTRLRKFEEAGPPPLPPREQDIRMQLTGGRTGKRAVVCTGLALEDLTFPFDLEIWYGDRVAVLGANGTGKSHFLRLLAAGGTDPEPACSPVDDQRFLPVAHDGVARLGARVRPGHFSQTHDRPDLVDRTLVDILWRGDAERDGMARHEAMRALNRYELSGQGDQTFGTLSGGQQARFLVLLLELSGATLLLLDEPTDNLDLASAQALEDGLASFAGTVIAVTHDRWFTRAFDRFVIFQDDGEVVESPVPVWDDAR